MSAIETTRVAPFGVAPASSALKFAGTVLSSVRNWNDIRVTRKALASLSDRELDDIGLCRGDIDQIGV